MQEEPAREVLDTVPTVMRFIRTEMRGHRAPGLSVPQFRSLVYIERAGGTSLGGVAEHLGLTPPSACKLIDGLVGRGMATRRESEDDRRRLTLEITPEGARAVAVARAETQKNLSRILGALDDEELQCVTRAMSALKRAFAAASGAVVEGRSQPHGDH
jgi:DNA-binding MarR family transcriptional regulator